MKEYEVSFYYTEGGRTWVKAKNKKEAEKKVLKQIEYNGMADFNYDNFKCDHRDYDIC